MATTNRDGCQHRHQKVAQIGDHRGKGHRVKGILAQARGVESITKYILRFPLKDFVAGYDALKAYTEIARDLVSQVTRLPLEESPGYKFNQQYRVTPEEIQYAVENEDSYSNILLDF